MVFKVHMCKSFERSLGWMDALIYISASLRSCLSSEVWSAEDHCSVLPSLSLSLSLSLCFCLAASLSPSTVRCVNTSHASSKASRLARVQPNYVQYYLEDAVVRTVTVTWLR